MKSITAMTTSPSLYAGLASDKLATFCPFLAISNICDDPFLPRELSTAISIACFEVASSGNTKDDLRDKDNDGERRPIWLGDNCWLLDDKRLSAYCKKSFNVDSCLLRFDFGIRVLGWSFSKGLSSRQYDFDSSLRRIIGDMRSCVCKIPLA